MPAYAVMDKGLNKPGHTSCGTWLSCIPMFFDSRLFPPNNGRQSKPLTQHGTKGRIITKEKEMKLTLIYIDEI